MDRSLISALITGLEESISRCLDILKKYSAENDLRILGYVFPLVPPEITSAFGIESMKLPESVINGESKSADFKDLYRAILIPEAGLQCLKADTGDLQLYRINCPAGYGEDAAVQLHNETAAMLESLFDIDLRSIDISKLQKRTELFEILRRSIRSICTICQGNRDLLSTAELDLVFEVAAIFPPEISLKLITPLLEELRKYAASEVNTPVKALIYGARKVPPNIIEFAGSCGISILEDDTCRGRRLFDISLNFESEYIFYELLDAYSYRPMSPCTRNAGERYELLYKLLRNYGISVVIFYIDEVCGISSGDISYLRIRMMRDGIDPLVIDGSNYKEQIESYSGRM